MSCRKLTISRYNLIGYQVELENHAVTLFDNNFRPVYYDRTLRPDTDNNDVHACEPTSSKH